MAVTVETHDKRERKITLTRTVDVIQNEVTSRLKRLARTVKMDGFRHGKVPIRPGYLRGYLGDHPDVPRDEQPDELRVRDAFGQIHRYPA